MTDYKNSIVTKPWGYEYLMYQSDKIGIWFLYIAEGCQTSLHCHPLKKTGYILLSGEAKVSFLEDSLNLKALSKLMIREGLFHSTKAISSGGVQIIEVENPPNKTNLVRLEDAYGRKAQPYEGYDSVIPLTTDCIIFRPPQLDNSAVYSISDVKLVVEHLKKLDPIKERSSEEILLILDGGLVSKDGDPILGPGDVITVSTFVRLIDTFAAPLGMSFISVYK
ncbi:MAG: hypothetical protein LBK93_03870 [Rickettsiales bacterium]|jgi:mannose-6-phosphate isomerase-like protein (cupin superfamily)|nr:hypothetical protein [Rickettsiales bacterium]